MNLLVIFWIGILLFGVWASNIDYRMILVGILVFGACILSVKDPKEPFEKPPDVFPWNEANLVHKKIPNSTNYECSWKGPEYTFK